MAIDMRRRTFPTVPAKVWWELRRRFQRTMPAQVTANYLQTVLGIQDGHAKNLIPQLKAAGLIGDDDGKPTVLANAWRTNEGYADACRRILETVYPTELRDAVPPAEPDRGAAQRWFMRETNVGQAAASRMASFYVLLADADPNGEHAPRDPSQNTGARTNRPVQPVVVSRPKARRVERQTPNGHDERPVEQTNQGPTIHIDVQVHIPLNATPDQIDAIFASMAKHLYRR